MINNNYLSEKRKKILKRVETGMNKVLNYQTSFDSYVYLWINDKNEFMQQFLAYGQTFNFEDLESISIGLQSNGGKIYLETEHKTGLVYKPPTLEQFKEQIDYYEEIYQKVSI